MRTVAPSADQARTILAWPLAVIGPAVVWPVATGVVASRTPDVVLDGGCTEPWGPCAAPMADVVTDIGRLGQAPVLMVGATLGLAVLRGVPARRRLLAALVLLAFTVVLAALVGITAVRAGAELG